MKRAKKETQQDNQAERTGATTPDASQPAQKDQASSEAPRRLHLFFLGTVQGIGFRYTALSIAEKFAISGWVRNCSDGRVELVAEGAPNVLESYLTALGDEMSGYIRKVDRTWENATGEFNGFSIAANA